MLNRLLGLKVRRKPFNWLSNEAWLNVLELSQSSKFFSNLPNDMAGNESMWRRLVGIKTVLVTRAESRGQSSRYGLQLEKSELAVRLLFEYFICTSDNCR